MRSQTARDQQTITIATALALSVGVMAVGGLLLALANLLGDVPDRVNTSLAYVTAALAVAAGLLYLVRNRRA